MQITTIAIPATARRVVAPYSNEDSSPATMSWVDIVAQKAIAVQQKPHSLRTNRGLVGLHGKHQPLKRPKVLTEGLSRTESNKTPTATPNPPPAQGATASGAKIKFFAPLSFKKEGRRRPPVKSILFEVGKAVVFDEDVCGIEFCGCFFEVFCEVFVGFIGYAVTDSEGVAFFLDVYVIVVFCH